MYLKVKTWQAIVLIFALLQVEIVNLFITKDAYSQETRRKLALFLIPLSKKDETATVALKGLLRGVADRLVNIGIERADTSPADDPNAIGIVRTKVEEGKKALNSGAWDQALRLFNEAEIELKKCFGAVDRATIALIYKGLGVSLLMAKRPDEAKNALRTSLLIYPEQRQSEYAYSLEARNMFAQVQREVQDASEGTIVVTTNPQQAEVYIDGEFKGLSPVRVSGMKEGDHLVTIFYEGYNAYGQFISVKGGAESPLNVMLMPMIDAAEYDQAIEEAQNAVIKGKKADSEGARLAKVTQATDVIFLLVKGEKTSFTLSGFYWRGGQATEIKKSLVKDATLVQSSQELLTVALGVKMPPETPLPSLEGARVALPEGKRMETLGSEGGEEFLVDPNSPLFKDVEKKEAKKEFYQQWWFWTAVGAVVAGGAGAGIYFLSKGGETSSGPRGDLKINIRGF